MVGTITFGGLGSGMDTESIVSALTNIERQGQTQISDKLAATNSSISNLSSVSSLLSKLKSASDALDTASEVGSYKVTSSDKAIVASANGLATPGSYAIKVTKLAKEQRTYSNTFATANTPLGQVGKLTLQVGTGTAKDIDIKATDKLDDVLSKINSSGLRVQASAFYDGSQYRIQLRGMDTGAANAVTITETGTTFGFNEDENKFQAAQDAEIELDGYKVKSTTNQITGAIRGVTLALTAESATPITVEVASDPDGLKTKLQSMVDAYNAVISKSKELAGSGSAKARDQMLAGDSTLRSLNGRISAALQTQLKDITSDYKSLSSIGLSLDRSGKLSLDATKLDKAVKADADAVTKVLAGTDTTKGVMDIMSSVADAFSAKDKGLLTIKSTAMTEQTKRLQARIDREESRINRYADQLRKQFTSMDTQVATWNNLGSYLSSAL